ncbi:hypothetical protein SLEP1_g38331 [Rubroshorea leprosula]|nr:hypothetical protein SLEP1_g38331 [Rubroshorea leprosula]
MLPLVDIRLVCLHSLNAVHSRARCHLSWKESSPQSKIFNVTIHHHVWY